MKASFRIARIADIDIGIHYTWLFAFVLITSSLAISFFPQVQPSWSALTYWIAGALSAFFLFISVLLHEMAHSLVARARGIPVSSITLFILGGVSNLQSEPEKPRAEFVMALAGPAMSMLLAAVFWGLSFLIGENGGVIGAIVGYLALVNALLAVFNLIPGFPLDGGRVLRSIIWGITNDLRKATNIAATVGQVFAWGFIGIGVYLVFTGNIFQGIWIAFIGWFINSAANENRRGINMRERMRGVKVNQLMETSPSCVSPEDIVGGVVDNIFFKGGYRATPVCNRDKVVGIVTITDVKKLSRGDWNNTPISRIMTSEPLYSVSPNDSLSDALEILAKHELNQLLVLEGEKISGLLSRANIIRYLQLAQELRLPPRKTEDKDTS